jgi:non-specific serine/threonine protein kinase
LVDKSLVVADSVSGDAIRYRMLETLRQYGQERLAESPRCGQVGALHAAHFLALAERAEPHLTGPEQAVWLARLDSERENLRRACSWFVRQARAEEGWRLGWSLWRFWSKRGYLAEGREQLAAALAVAFDGAPNAALARALQAAGTLAAQQADYAAAQSHYEDSLALRRVLRDREGVANLLSNLGIIARYRGDNHAAKRLYAESLSIRREQGDTWGVATSLANLGIVTLELGDCARARALHEESLSLRREVGDRWAIANSLHNLANVAREQADFLAARGLYFESIAMTRELGDRWALAYLLEDVACLAAAVNQPASALRLAAAATELRAAIAAPLSPAERTALDRRLRSTRSPGSAEDTQLTLDEALDLALSLEVDQPPPPGPWDGLTRREREVADLVGRGLTNRQIAETLVVGDKTVETHVAHILAKLGYSSRSQVIHRAATIRG